jgi:hypothetical protein
LTVLEKHPSKVYYFTLHPTKINLFQELYELHKAYFTGVKLEFNWEFIRIFGTDDQKKVFNIFRNMYISYLLGKFCKPSTSQNTMTKDNCIYKIIGTPAISVESDMDFDLSVIENNDIGQVINNITDEHHKYFNKELDELFDTNLYGSVFIYDENTHNKLSLDLIEKQNVWSWIRSVETLNNDIEPYLLKEFKKYLTPSHQHIFNKALYKLTTEVSNEAFCNTNVKPISRSATLPQSKDLTAYPISRSLSSPSSPSSMSKTNSYRMFLSNYFSGDYNQGFEDKVECFSKAKYYENETYRSLGAVLHIVNKLSGINENYFVHSVYDQYGFIIENVIQHNIKGNSLPVRIPKISKYISRICNAIEKLSIQDRISVEGKENVFLDIKNISEELNEVRRQDNKQKEKELAKKLQKLFPNVFNISNSNSNSVKINNSQTGKLNFLLGVYEVLVKPVGKYQDSFNTQTQGGMNKNKQKRKVYKRK